MLETFTPAVCGSRKRQIVAQALFAGAAVMAAAALGLALGLAGSALGAERAVLAAAALALLAAAREAGLVRLPLPQARRQVPERWRSELPMPVWASGYGAGLGAGLFTFQPVSTFWIACAGALALANPATAALCFSLYGAGRALMVVWPRRRADDATAAVERLTTRRGALLKANVVALVACGILLAIAPAAGGAVRVARDAYDPTVHSGAFAFARQGGGVIVRPSGGPDIVYSDGSQPALFKQYLAYVDAFGIRVVRWADRTEVARVANTNASRPALEWPLLAYVRRDAQARRLVTHNLVTNRVRVQASSSSATDLGRPSLHSNRLAWHTVSRSRSRIVVKRLGTTWQRVVASSKIALLANPSVANNRIVWTESRRGVSRLKLGSITSSSRRTAETMRSATRGYWTTTFGSAVYSTRWTFGSGAADIYRTNL